MTHPERPDVLIVAPDARDYAAALRHRAGRQVPHTPCDTVAQALEVGAGHPILFGTPDMIASVIDDLPQVEWVQSMWAGVRPLLDGPRSDYVLTGVKGVFGPLMAEYVAGYLLAHELRVVERWKRQRRHAWYERPSGTLRGKRAGIMGTGSIGCDIADMLVKLDLRVLGLNRSGRPCEPFERVFAAADLHTFLRELDYLITVLPDTPQTRHILDDAALNGLPPHALLVNVGRGSAVDTAALIDALENKRLGGAVLDVFEDEPLPADSPVWNAPGLIVTGHVAAPSLPDQITPIFLDNYERFCSGQPLRHRIDFERGY